MTIKVSLAYSPEADSCVTIPLILPKGSIVRDAISAANFYRDYPETVNYIVGIFSTVVNMDEVLNDGDRIEIYRPLQQDPKLARRVRAKKKS